MSPLDPFLTLGIERRFDVDLARLERQHRELSRALHPDRYVSAPPGERRAALERAVEVNEAFRVVRDPVRRAEALLTLAGVPVGEDREPKAAPAFLMEVMEHREALAEAKAARDRAAIEALTTAVKARESEAERALARGLDAPDRGAPPASLVGRLGELRFYRRFLEEADAALEEWTDGSL